jgi:hypothetical protein
VVGLQRPGRDLRWNPAPERPLADDDRVVVVATREGLGLLLRRAPAAAIDEEDAPTPAAATHSHLPGPRRRRRPDDTGPLPRLPRAQPDAPYPGQDEQ